MKTSGERRFYVYAYLRTDGTPYYIGKGTKKRVTAKHSCAVPPQDRCVYLFENLTDAEAISREMALIALFGRKDIGTGILRNLTDGGDGTAGRVRSLEERQKISLAREGCKMSDQAKQRMMAARARTLEDPLVRERFAAAQRGKKQSEETKAKRAAALKGRKHSRERIEKVRQALKGRVVSVEQREKMSVAAASVWSRPGHRQKMSHALKGRTCSDSNKAALSLRHKGVPKSDEQKKLIALSNKRTKLSKSAQEAGFPGTWEEWDALGKRGRMKWKSARLDWVPAAA